MSENNEIRHTIYENRSTILQERIIYWKNRDKCVICQGAGRIKLIQESECDFCNGLGIFMPVSEAFMLHHICQCLYLDRKICAVCFEKCHHDTSFSPLEQQ